MGVSMLIASSRNEYALLALFIFLLTPPLYLAFRHFILVYGLIWLAMVSIGPLSKKYPRARLVQIGMFIALVISLLMGMVLR